MKTMILMAALLTASIAQAAEPDDTVTVYNAHKVTVVSNDSLLQVEVDGTDRQPDYHYQTTLRNTDGNYESTSVTGDLFSFGFGNKFSKKRARRPLYDSEFHVFLGFNGATGNNDVVKTNLWGGANIGMYVDWGIHPWRDGNRFSFGCGVEWSNWRMTNRNQFVKANDGTVSVVPLPEGADPKFSRVKTFSLIFPIMYSYSKKTGASRWVRSSTAPATRLSRRAIASTVRNTRTSTRTFTTTRSPSTSWEPSPRPLSTST